MRLKYIMDLFSKIKGDVELFLQSQKDIVDASGSDLINIKKFEARGDLIANLEQLLNLIPQITGEINSTLQKAKIAQTKEVALFDSLINKNWTQVKTKKKKSYAGVVNTPIVPVPQQLSATKYTKIKVTENLFLPAIAVTSFDQVKQDGDLYYIESSDHFAIRIFGHLFHGNIGIIYTDEKSPGKIKNCKFAEFCTKQNNCDYYHDPTKFSGSKDHRNFIASSFLYAPPNSSFKARPRSRRIGSREHLDADINAIPDEEISRFYDQVMHDLLCAMLLSYTCSPNQII